MIEMNLWLPFALLRVGVRSFSAETGPKMSSQAVGIQRFCLT